MMRLTMLREKKGWSKAELARQSGLNAATIGLIESGRWNPYPVQLQKLAAAFDYKGDPEKLIGDVPARR